MNSSGLRDKQIANTKTQLKTDAEPLFQAGSISKPLAALAALQLFENGKVDLDKDVNTYLTGWKVPDSEFGDEEKLTLKRLLTHTGGTTVHGFPGYANGDKSPTIEEVLSGKGNTEQLFLTPDQMKVGDILAVDIQLWRRL